MTGLISTTMRHKNKKSEMRSENSQEKFESFSIVTHKSRLLFYKLCRLLRAPFNNIMVYKSIFKPQT